MSLYKAHNPILEIRVEDSNVVVTDWYGSRLWIILDKKRDTIVHGYYRKKDTGIHDATVDIPAACTVAQVARLKLTNSGQRCKIFMKYRRPQFNVSL